MRLLKIHKKNTCMTPESVLNLDNKLKCTNNSNKQEENIMKIVGINMKDQNIKMHAMIFTKKEAL